MPAAASTTAADRRATPRLLGWAVSAGLGLVAALLVFVTRNNGTPAAQTVGDLAILAAAAVATGSCAWAAVRASEERRAWTLLAVAAAIWTFGQAMWTTYGLTRDHVYPFPSLADLGYIGYVVPAAAALFSFPRVADRGAARLRPLLDAFVIALAVLFISWATVLGTVYQAGGANLVTRLIALLYPSADVLMVSLVLSLGMRRPAGQRMPWLALGGGLMTLAVTDSSYISSVFAGDEGLTGSPLAAGWTSAWLLVALAPWVPRSSTTGASAGRLSALAIELLPYAPLLVAVVVSANVALTEDPFLLVVGALLLALVAARQVMIVYQNVTLTRDLEAKVSLRTSELSELAGIVASSNDAIVSTSFDGVVTSWNLGAQRLYGYRADEAIGQHISMLIPPERRASEGREQAAILARVCAGERVETAEFDRLRKDGSVVAVAVTVSPIYGEDEVVALSAIHRDVSERRAKDAALAAAREEALESSRLKSEFLATMSHEIRTPMNGVIGLTSLLLETPLNTTQRQYAEGVKSAGESLLAVINDILDFSKLEAGKVELETADFDPRTLVDEVASLLAVPAHAKSLELVAYCRPDVPALLRGDGGRIRQILLNLASNAVKFTSAGEVVIKARTLTVVDGEPAPVPWVRFEVSDTGIGISADGRSRLFESFAQADASTTRRYGGTGLGLAISRKLTDAMGGQIGVDSEVGAGSTFWFELPLPIAAHNAFADAPLSPDLLADLRVLVVDDNATNRLVLESQLAAWRLRPDSVERPDQAIAKMQQAAADGDPYAVAVLDMCMPQMDGAELARLISADPALADTRLIMLTSTMQYDTKELKLAGVAEWLTKPVRSSEFYDRLMRLMAPKAADVNTQSGTRHGPQAQTTSLSRVLVVEDNALNQLVAEGVVSGLGYQVDLVANGAEALEAIEATAYSAVLMDCHMPVMDGFAATKEIRRREGGGRRLPIIAMTAGAMAEDRDRCLAAGMDDYVTKPVDVTAVHDALARWVREPAEALPAIPDQQGPPGTEAVVIDTQRQSVLRELGPDDGWGLLPEAVNAFLDDYPVTMAAVRQAAQTRDTAAVRDSAHRLKGASANIGAIQVAVLCERLEGAAASGELPRSQQLAELESALSRSARILGDALRSIP